MSAPFVWYELMTSDPRAAEQFYSKVVGWRAKDSGMPDVQYTLLNVGETPVAGLMALSPEAVAGGAMPAWIGYIGADDVDACVSRIAAGGGTTCHAAEDIPGVGRFAVLADPGGAVFCVFKGSSAEPPAPLPAGTPGTIGWHELHAADGAKAWAFYSQQFGWTKDEAMDMGPMGVYQLFKAGAAQANGGMMTKMPEMPAPAWVYYFNVEGVDAATTRITDNGGTVINGPMEVPGGQWIVQGLDPQGAMFALVAPGR
ncbi:MAG TPA: VOC family protein [Burkholderiaceae bacterium]|nr:VOC family protein [Burkholderiaceae bacterium]